MQACPDHGYKCMKGTAAALPEKGGQVYEHKM